MRTLVKIRKAQAVDGSTGQEVAAGYCDGFCEGHCGVKCSSVCESNADAIVEDDLLF